MLIISADEVRQVLPMDQAVLAMKQAFQAISAGSVNMPLRTHIDLPENSGTTLIMPAHVHGQNEALTVKIVSVFGNNPKSGLARIQSAVTVFDPATGKPLALIEGSSLTGIRTAAASGAATDLLARKEATQLAILGAGVQARSHIHAMISVRDIQEVRVFAPNTKKLKLLIDEFTPQRKFANCKFIAATSANSAIEGADIVCTVTTSHQSVFDDKSISAGVHINAVGSYQPHVVEIPGATVARARVYVDHLQSALDESGELIQAIKAGLITAEHVKGEVGQVILKEIEGRTDDNDITLFKSVGNAVEDALAARTVLSNAKTLKVGTEIDF